MPVTYISNTHHEFNENVTTRKFSANPSVPNSAYCMVFNYVTSVCAP